MHGNIGPAIFECGLQFFDEQPFATHLAEGAVQDLVATGSHAQQFDRVPERQ